MVGSIWEFALEAFPYPGGNEVSRTHWTVKVNLQASERDGLQSDEAEQRGPQMKWRDWQLSVLVTVMALFLVLGVQGRSAAQITTIPSANCNIWDVEDQFTNDTGDISDGGQDAFDNGGLLRIRVLDGSANVLVDDQELCGFGLAWDDDRRWGSNNTIEAGYFMQCGGGDDAASVQEDGKLKVRRSSVSHHPYSVSPGSGVMVFRDLYAPAATDYMRYIDTFNNTSGALRDVYVGWGGNLGSDSHTTIAASSSGHLAIDTADYWAGHDPKPDFNPAGPAVDPPVGYAFARRGRHDLASVGDYFSNPSQPRGAATATTAMRSSTTSPSSRARPSAWPTSSTAAFRKRRMPNVRTASAGFS